MSLLEHARRELSLLGGTDDEMQQAMNRHLLTMVEAFAAEGHSGFSASYAISALTKLLNYEPLTPLTGADDEWCEYSPGRFQNKRCGHVFKDEDGTYDSEGRIFREPNGSCYMNRGSRVPVTFPYVPYREYVDVLDAAREDRP